jgi:hypothetical protein
MMAPGSPRTDEIDRTHRRLVAALAATWRLAEHGGRDFAGSVSAALGEVARSKGGIEALVKSRPGSWEAGCIRQLGATATDWC